MDHCDRRAELATPGSQQSVNKLAISIRTVGEQNARFNETSVPVVSNILSASIMDEHVKANVWARVAQKVRYGQLRSSQRTQPHSSAPDANADYAEEEKHEYNDYDGEAAADNEPDYQLVAGSINDAAPRAR